MHAWERLAGIETDSVNPYRILALCEKLERVRALLDAPIRVHSMFRSIEYNKDQNINPVNDVHTQCLAVDFDCFPHLKIEQIKDRLRPLLDKLEIRMERGTPTWVHIDLKLPGPSGREFTP